MIKAETVVQFHILTWLESNFETTSLIVELVDGYTIKITDPDGARAIVRFVSKSKIILNEID